MDLSEQFQKAQQAFEKGNNEYALEVLEHLLSLSPSSRPARHLLHLVKQRRASQLSSIQKFFNSLLALPRLLSAQMTQSKAKQERWKTISAYESVLSVDPYNAKAMISMANLLTAEKELQGAVQVLEETLGIHPKHIGVLKQLAGLYLQLDQSAKTRESLQKILQIDPKNIQADRDLKNLDAMDTLRGLKEESQS